MADTESNALSKLILSVFRLNGRIGDWGDLLCAPLNLSTTRWQILGAIKLASRPLTAPQIAHSMGLTRQGVQKQLNALMADGFVTQQINPVHERSHLYSLTQSGKEIEEKAIALYTEWLDQATAHLSPDQINDTLSVLNTVTCNLESILHHQKKPAP